MKNLFAFVLIFVLNTSATLAQNVLEAIAIDSGGRLGASLLVLETGQSLWILPDVGAPMQHVCQFPIAMAALAAVDQNKLQLEQKVLVAKDDLVGDKQRSPIRDEHPNGNVKISVKELVRYAVAETDGTASDVLLRLLGGPPVVREYLAQLGIHDIKIMDNAKDIGKSWTVQYRNTTTPKAMIDLLRAFQQGKGLSKKSHELLLKWMMETTTDAGRIKGLLPTGTPVAHMAGSSGSHNGLAAAHNDVGIVTLPNGHHMAVAVFVTDSTAPETSRDLTIAKITKLGWDSWNAK